MIRCADSVLVSGVGQAFEEKVFSDDGCERNNTISGVGCRAASTLRLVSDRTAASGQTSVCTDNLNAGVVVMKSAQDGA
jgi:hypothetical protein